MSFSPVPSAHGEESMFERTGEVLGRGAFSVVYKGRHRLTNQAVAIKVFKDTDDVRFGHTIKCFERIGGSQKSFLRSDASSGAKWSPPQAESEMASIRNESIRSIAGVSYRPSKEMAHQLRLALVAKELVVSMLDFSKGPDGKPGKENGEYFIVMELGDVSLEEFIDYRSRIDQPLTASEIRSILNDVVRMVCLLHSHGLAHLDVKPANIMLFNSTFWKLIDFDGCFRAASMVDVTQSDIAFTPLYCAPEIAAVIVKMSSQLKISRLMDVWSVGAIGAELALMKPVFENVFEKLYKDGDDSPFLNWLVHEDLKVAQNEDAIQAIDPALASLLIHHMLVRDPQKRFSLPQILKHPFFTSVPSVKHAWSITPEVHQPVAATKYQRVLSLQQSDLSLDLSNPLESDDAVLVNDSSMGEDDNHGLSPMEMTPMISPQAGKVHSPFFRLICCKGSS